MPVRMGIAIERLRLKAPFRISGYVFEGFDVVVVTLEQDGHVGRGEAAGAYYLGETAETMRAALEPHRTAIEAGLSRDELGALLPPGGARNAVDCALWELEAARAARPAWRIAGIERPRPLVTTFTLSADDPAVVEEGARRYATAQAIKLKLSGERELDAARLAAVRRARPDVWLGVDANQGYRRDGLDQLIGLLVEHRVSLLEQPLPRGAEADLEGLRSPVPIAADESALSLADVDGLFGRFDVVNIKLDKCGGLTEALEMARRARELGLRVMVGNMISTSLAMAPAFLVGQLCDVVDLDGPTFLVRDREPSVTYRPDGTIWCDEAVWAGGALTPA
ncbi:MAG: L-alanine-DL-glutamate epimerase (EC [uncultured Sphingomonadaceae bacterium]|uniref:Dipeptide epimerase n=1 Tax=uncultured Sphingomonadaceae bacterium TaxID=169976 RepID=A0A6J4SRT4_9SPHN|nr:MAG: L-alanine-DL-glutamate epimerase (EC [uncultured Sphingomonadaceae bacterium]